MRLKNCTRFLIELLLLLFAVVLSLLTGPSGPIGGEGYTGEIILDLRAPRTLLALLVGGSLALAGVLMQALFRNPLADPYILGTSSGSALFAILIAPSPLEPLLAFVGGVATTMMVYAMAWRERTETLLLVGMAMGSLASSLLSLLLFTKTSALSSMLFWLFGGLGLSTWGRTYLLLTALVLSMLLVLPLSMELDSLLLGEEKSRYLGVDVRKLMFCLLLVTCAITSLSVAVAGMIGFVGLMVPHLCRRIVGPKHRVLIPFSVIAGGVFLLFADVLARVILAPNEVPIGIITSMCGAPFFMYLVWRQRNAVRRWG
jgi:iron complex transport system permease protein